MYPKKICWPFQKNGAVMLSIEVDNEFIWLGMDPNNAARPKSLSMGTYGTTCGLDRVLRVLREKNVKATFFILGIFAEKYLDAVEKIIKDGHEIALHGYEHRNYALLSRSEQMEDIRKGMDAIGKITRKRLRGFRVPEGNITPDTMSLIQSFGFDYDSSQLDYDLPYYYEGEVQDRKLVEIPMNFEMQDFINFAFNFFPPFPHGVDSPAVYRDVLHNWKREAAAYQKRERCCVCRFDPQSIGTPGRIGLLEELIDQMLQMNMWIATGQEIAEYYRRKCS